MHACKITVQCTARLELILERLGPARMRLLPFFVPRLPPRVTTCPRPGDVRVCESRLDAASFQQGVVVIDVVAIQSIERSPSFGVELRKGANVLAAVRVIHHVRVKGPQFEGEQGDCTSREAAIVNK